MDESQLLDLPPGGCGCPFIQKQITGGIQSQSASPSSPSRTPLSGVHQVSCVFMSTSESSLWRPLFLSGVLPLLSIPLGATAAYGAGHHKQYILSPTWVNGARPHFPIWHNIISSPTPTLLCGPLRLYWGVGSNKGGDFVTPEKKEYKLWPHVKDCPSCLASTKRVDSSLWTPWVCPLACSIHLWLTSDFRRRQVLHRRSPHGCTWPCSLPPRFPSFEKVPQFLIPFHVTRYSFLGKPPFLIGGLTLH